MSAPVLWSLFVILSGSPQMQLFGPWPERGPCETLKADMLKAFPKRLKSSELECVGIPQQKQH
jgi:hypothetical protein